MKQLTQMTAIELEREATRILRAAEPRKIEEPDMGARPESWQLAPVASIECDCDDCDACEIAATFADFSGARLAPRFEAIAWGYSSGKCVSNSDYMRDTRARNPAVAKEWRAAERAVRHDPVRREQIRKREKLQARKRRARHARIRRKRERKRVYMRRYRSQPDVAARLRKQNLDRARRDRAWRDMFASFDFARPKTPSVARTRPRAPAPDRAPRKRRKPIPDLFAGVTW